MIGLPKSTEFNRRIPKQKFYENLTVSPTLKRFFVDQIKVIYWRNKIAATTMNLAAGEVVTEIEIFEVKLNESKLDESVLRQIDKEIADLGAKNLVITRLHTSGVLDAADYAKQTSEIGNRITDLRIERRKKLTEDEDDVLLDTLKELNGILEEYEPTAEFDNDLFEQIVQDITVNDNTQITFRLLGDIQLTEKINEKGRCKSA